MERLGRLGRLERWGDQGDRRNQGNGQAVNTGDTGETRKIWETVEQIQSFYLILFYEIFIFTNLLIELFEMISKSSPSPLDVFCKLNLKHLLVFSPDFPNVWLA